MVDQHFSHEREKGNADRHPAFNVRLFSFRLGHLSALARGVSDSAELRNLVGNSLCLVGFSLALLFEASEFEPAGVGDANDVIAESSHEMWLMCPESASGCLDVCCRLPGLKLEVREI